LPEEAGDDPAAIKAAIEIVISDLAFELEQERSKERNSLLRWSGAHFCTEEQRRFFFGGGGFRFKC
jgi:hypothetical protein